MGTSLGFLYSEEEGALLLAFFTLRKRGTSLGFLYSEEEGHFSWLSLL